MTVIMIVFMTKKIVNVNLLAGHVTAGKSAREDVVMVEKECTECGGVGGWDIDCADGRGEHFTRGEMCEECQGHGAVEIESDDEAAELALYRTDMMATQEMVPFSMAEMVEGAR